MKLIFRKASLFACALGILAIGSARADNQKNENTYVTVDETALKELAQNWQKAAAGEIQLFTFLFGKIGLHPDHAMHLHPRFPGVVKEVYKSAGDTVKAGDVLARVESSIGVQSFDLTSTISGVVLERNISLGQSVNEETETFSVADVSFLLATLVAYPKDITHLKRGMQVSLQGSNPSRTVTGEVSHISPLFDERTRTVPVHIVLKNISDKILPGEYVIGKVPTEKKSVATVIPVNILPSQGEELRILVRREKGLTLQRVILGSRDENGAEVLSGLLAGDEYLAVSQDKLLELLQVKDHEDK